MSHEKSILITGASRGIGKALCLEALQRGYRVHAAVREIGAAPAGTQPHLLSDVRDRTAVAKLLETLAPELTHFVSNAGVGEPLSPKKADTADKAADLMEINSTASIYSAYRIAYEWIRLEKKKTHITLISSLSAGRGLPRNGPYVASKTAQLSFAQGFEHDVATYGIGVSVVLPGFIDTDMTADLPQKPFLISSAEAARRIMDGMEAGTFRISFPLPTRFGAWLLNALPEPLFRTLVSFLHRKRFF